MKMKQSCKALICAIEGELDGRHCTEEQAAAILDHALPSLTEALARAEAERNEVCDGLDRQTARLIAAQAQLAEAVALLQKIEQRMYGEDVENRFTDLIADIDRITAQVEQQGYCERCGCSGEISEGCGPAGCSCRGEKEAQGAQAGDEAKSFERWWTSTEILRKNKMMLAQEAWMARAALATQPAPGKPVAEMISDPPGKQLIFLVNGELELPVGTKLYKAAPPAAAHGDEAVLWELLDKSVYGSDEQQAVARAKIRQLLAMRAQGDDRLLFTDAIMPGGLTET